MVIGRVLTISKLLNARIIYIYVSSYMGPSVTAEACVLFARPHHLAKPADVKLFARPHHLAKPADVMLFARPHHLAKPADVMLFARAV